ncbi:MAG TPA: alpha-2-macroglobulin family protein, partial [Pyrinomonadaceae bacterium]
STTNRTELKRFDLRVTKEAIHIYFIRHDSEINPKLPHQFYVSTFYADGAPARCDLEIKGNYPQVQGENVLASTRTNSYGASKLEIRVPEKPFPEAQNRFNLQISARDKQGNAGIFNESLYLDENDEQIRVKTDKTIYLPNENIEAKIHSSENNESVYVDVLRNRSVIYSKRVKLGDGRAAFQIPFRPDFKGELSISAYFKTSDESERIIIHSKNVIYPSPSDLKLNVKSLKSVYRPNEEAKIAFSARSASGISAETALGVVILDKAIEERAQTERLPDNYKDLRVLNGTADAFGNVTRKALNNLDLNKPPDDDLQLAAEFLLLNKAREPKFFESDSDEENFREIFEDYFAEKLQPFENILKAHYEKTAEYPRDENTLRGILSANKINFDDLRDAWGMPYKAEFVADGRYATMTLTTASADKKFGTDDDFSVRRMQFEWFTKTQNALATILSDYTRQSNKAPQTIDELKAVWKQAGFDADAARDGWNRPLYITTVKYNRVQQKPFAENLASLDGEIQQVVRTRFVVQEVLFFKLRSQGWDAANAGDDFELGAFPVVVSEKDLSNEPAGKISKSRTNSSSGAITGTIFDPTGAVIPNISVEAVNQASGETFSGESNDEGDYLIANLPSGKYRIMAQGGFGFNSTSFENIVVSSMTLIKLDINLYVASSSATVEVTAQELDAIASTSGMSLTTTKRNEAKSISGLLDAPGGEQASTPRVREYFPETLLWQPELITDKTGRAELKFTLADSLTTWKLYAFGSTETGEVGLVEKELQTFQPFFAELEPPRILTEGDEISLPVPVRNYTGKRQKVSVSMTENTWSSLLNGATRQIEIAPDDSQNAIFNFRAAAPVKDGRQKVTALAKGEGDAIEKPVTVKPNGKEIVELQARLFRESAAFEVNFPANSFPNTRRAELKIYPNMLAHVAESVEGLLKRPYGCGEQTTSSTYPNLLILKIEKDFGKAVAEKTKNQARDYLRQGYERLLNYQTPGGGFSYWGKTDTPNVSLTAYILRFLNDARSFIEVDENVIENAQSWLLKQQQANGGWQMNYVNTDSSTAYIARSLSMNPKPDEETKKALRAASEFLKNRLPEIKDAYTLANFAPASAAAGDLETASTVADKLDSALQNEKESFFWTTGNTAFYGWGKTASIETTALVMQVLLRFNENNKFATNLSRGLAFLLKNKDQHGVWYSTQTTVNVLDTLILLHKSAKDAKPNAVEKTGIYINGRKIQDFDIDLNALSYPLLIDVSPYLNEASNRIEIKNGANAAFIQAQIVAAHYIPWKDAVPKTLQYFDLKVDFDKTEAKIGEQISCAVSVKRKDNRYGMILAEIGIPPGADVDRGSLENAKKSDENISRYDVLPDKIIVYFWADAQPANFNFKFKPRYGINAQTAPSLVYDYYNEEAKAMLAPARFVVK